MECKGEKPYLTAFEAVKSATVGWGRRRIGHLEFCLVFWFCRMYDAIVIIV